MAATGSRRTQTSPRAVAAPRVRSHRLFGQLAFLLLLLLSIGVGALSGLVFVYSSNLPQVNELFDYRPDVMTELYSDDGTQIGSFALERRVMVTYNQIPPVVRNAILSIEDRHFESHFGVDVIRIVRAGITDLVEWRKAQGAGTLTMQLSRMLFLTPQKTFRRKIQETLLAIQIERHFTKAQIFSMYCNEVSLGGGSYGFEAASEYYFGKHLTELNLPEAAMLAGLPRSPTYYSPVLHPRRARFRRDEVLYAMYTNGKIRREQYEKARMAPLGLHVQRWNKEIAPYFVDDVRGYLDSQYGATAINTGGMRVYTTLDLKLQNYAVHALRQGLREDDKRRGWRGPEKNILKKTETLPDGTPATLETYRDQDWSRTFAAGQFVHGLVMAVKPDYALVRFGQDTARLTPADFVWTLKATPPEVFSTGDVDLFLITSIKGRRLHVTLDQHPTVEGGILVIDNRTGAIKAMVGGYDYNESKFNRAVQAERQVGSSFKVYVYSQALLDGLSPFDTVVDEPVSYGGWAPHNYDDKFEGRITLLHALAESRNVPAVKLLAHVGVDNVIKLCRKFGITSRLVPDLPLALGASSLTLLEHTSGFTTFPDDGLHLAVHAVSHVTDYDGRVLDDYVPQVTDVLPAPDARLMVSMLREVINSGTAAHARALAAKYPVAGKTGTTNNFTDAWFIGFSPTITCGVWVGFDDRRSLEEPANPDSIVAHGFKEEGSHVALPIWMDFMSHALQGQPVRNFPDSPLLTNPGQVKQILASAATPSLLTEVPGAAPALSQNTPPTKPAGAAQTAKASTPTPATRQIN
ncbi:MAG: penicillin-binding protein 1A [Terriglobia bacterium]